MLTVRTFETAQEFLQSAGAELEAREAANSLMLGVCGQLVRHPERFPMPVCLKTVEQDGALLLAATMTPPHNLLLAGQPEQTQDCAAQLAAAPGSGRVENPRGVRSRGGGGMRYGTRSGSPENGISPASETSLV